MQLEIHNIDMQQRYAIKISNEHMQ